MGATLTAAAEYDVQHCDVYVDSASTGQIQRCAYEGSKIRKTVRQLFSSNVRNE